MFKVMSKKEVLSQVYKGSRNREENDLLRNMLNKLAVGEGLMVEKKEWYSEQGVGNLVARLNRILDNEKVYKYRSKADGSGWVIQRTK
jgi:hypothetical protein